MTKTAVCSTCVSKGLLIGLMVLATSVGAKPLHAADSRAQSPAARQGLAGVHVNPESASPDARRVALWVVTSANNHGLPFMVVDKANAMVFVFHANGQLRGATPALLGSALGDDSAPGIGDRKLADILPQERTTPAGRFLASLDRNLHGNPMLWVDYATAISLHPVITSDALERRAQRLATATPLDNRISYGCINVPALFFKNVVMPAFKKTPGFVYVLPEVRRLEDVFSGFNSGGIAITQQSVPNDDQARK